MDDSHSSKPPKAAKERAVTRSGSIFSIAVVELRTHRIMICTLFSVLAIDQLTKWAAVILLQIPSTPFPFLPFFKLWVTYNPGISFGLFADTFAGAPYLLVAMKSAVLITLIVVGGDRRSPLRKIALGMIVGGALGNILDRLRVRRVVDFIDVNLGSFHWPNFNFADVAIFIGAVLFLVSSLRSRSEHSQERVPLK
jgi:signal peptidase II